MNTLKIAISQFPVSRDLTRNESYVNKHILKASKEATDIIHFPETALTGYETKLKDINWNLLKQSLKRIRIAANKQSIYVVLGLHHKVRSIKKPFNCTYLISPNGKIIGRYFKNKLYKKEKNRFSSKINFLIKRIKGVTCGFLICYDSCYPKLFEYYRNHGVKLLFLSYYNANSSRDKNNMDHLMKAQISSRASDNLMYISGSNSSSRYSGMPSSFAHPDGKLISLPRHKAGILICEYPSKKLEWTYDNSVFAAG
jgi:predicted amidohydrolase